MVRVGRGLVELAPGERCYRSSTCRAAMRLRTFADAVYADLCAWNDANWASRPRNGWL